MEKLNGYFIGYKAFNSSKTGKNYFVLSFLFLEIEDGKVSYFVKDIFTEEKKYNEFCKDNGILDVVEVNREISGDNVRYYI